MATNALALTVDRTTGAITFKDKAGREVVAERPREPRCVLGNSTYLFLKNAISDSVHAVNMSDLSSTYVKSAAKVITDPSVNAGMVLVKDKFGLLLNGTPNAYFCDIVSQGAHFKSEGTVLDYYYIKADSTDSIKEIAKTLI